MADPRIKQLGGIVELDRELTGLVNANSARIANAATPIDGYDLATKDYVDGYATSVGLGPVLDASNETEGADIVVTGGTNFVLRSPSPGGSTGLSISYDIDSTGANSSEIDIDAQNNSGGGTGGQVSISSGYGDSGGTLNVAAGNANANGGFGGSVIISSGGGAAGTSAVGGGTYVSGGIALGTGAGGVLSLSGGNAVSGAGGGVSITGGDTGGTVAGDITITPGTSASAADLGSIFLQDDTGGNVVEVSGRSGLTAPFTVYTDADIQGKLTVAGLIDPTGLVLDRQSSIPGGVPAAGKVTFWVRDSDGYGIITDESGQNTVLGQGGGGGGGNLTAPTIVEDGYVAIASGGDLTYISGVTDGYVLTWNSFLEIWEPQEPTGGSGSTPSLVQVLAVGADANSLNITGLADPVNPQDAATKAYIDGYSFPTATTPTLDQVTAEGNSAGSVRITDVLDPVDPQDAATKAYIDGYSFPATPTPALADVLAEGANANSLNITGLADPVNPQDAATKAYIDGYSFPVITPTLAQVTAEGNSAGSVRITDVLDPVDPQDAATKAYIDGYAFPTTPTPTLADVLVAGSLTDGNSIDDNLSVNGDGYFDGKLTVTGLIDPTGLVLDRQAAVPGGTPAAGKATLWIRDSDGYVIATDENDNDVVLSGGGGGGGTSNLTEPTVAEDGYVALASSGDLTYLAGGTDGYVLTWNAALDTWESQAPTGISATPTLAQVLAEGADANSLNITGLADPIDPQDAATKAYIDGYSFPTAVTPTLAQVTAEGNSAGSVRITDVLDPVDPQDAATKAYVDGYIGGGNVTAPTAPEDGYIAIASGEDLTYLAGNIDGYVLTWNASLGVWESAAPTGISATPTLAQVLVEGADANSLNITGLADPVNPQDAATKSYIDGYAFPTTPTPTLAEVLVEGSSANDLNISDVADPVDNQDAATKAWVEAQIAAISIVTAPVAGEDGYVPIASGGDLTYLAGETDGYVLTWNEALGAWEAAAPTGVGGGVSESTIDGYLSNIDGYENDWNPAGWDTATIVIMDTDGSDYDITGFDSSASVIRKTLANASANNITLKNADSGSLAANQLALPSDLVILPNGSVQIFYDSTNSVWRAV